MIKEVVVCDICSNTTTREEAAMLIYDESESSRTDSTRIDLCPDCVRSFNDWRTSRKKEKMLEIVKRSATFPGLSEHRIVCPLIDLANMVDSNDDPK